jgi:signal transduction histidine kinase
VAGLRDAAARIAAAYRRLPIGWRLAGGSAALTGVILLGFAVIVGVLTTRRLQADFNDRLALAADDLAAKLEYRYDLERRRFKRSGGSSLLSAYAAPDKAVIRVVNAAGDVIDASSADAPYLPGPAFGRVIQEYRGFRVETRPVLVRLDNGVPYARLYVQYADRLSDTKVTARRVQVLLGLGVLGGTALALLAGLATARRAMAPITELTETARRIERTRDPTVQIPHPEANDEVAELANTLESMLAALDNSRGETEAALSRQREFVADASHELRTPLTSVLANLELLEDVTEGEAREAVTSALRSSRRMRRLVADLLLLARADSGRVSRHEPIDLSLVVAEAAGELEPVAGDHELQVDAEAGAVVDGARDELHRLVLNLMENALRHTDPGPPSRPPCTGATAKSSSPWKTTAPASHPIRPRRCSSASSAALLIAEGPRASASPSSAPSRIRTRDTSRSKSRSTGAAPASSSGSRPPRGRHPRPSRRGASLGYTSTTTGSTIGRRRSLS